MKRLILTSAVALTAATAASANDFAPAMEEYVRSSVMTWMNDPVLVEAIRAQNTTTAGYSQSQIDELDQTWRAEVGSANSPTVTPVLENSAAEYLRQRVAEAGGVITEVFIMDAVGLNVAASDATSDYWQGDEEKFTMTFPAGEGAMHFGEVEFDESSQRYQGQVSLTIVDPATNEPVGAMTIGLDAEALF